MRLILVLAFAAVAYAGTILPHKLPEHALSDSVLDSDSEIEIITDPEDGIIAAPQFIVSWQIRRFIRKLQKQMPCGFEQYGIPPLAPLKIREAEFTYEKGMLTTFDKVFRFRIDGLDDFKIKKFKLNMITSKITFDFLFSNIKASATKYETDTLLDAMREMGLSVQYEGDGSLEFGLKNLRIAGTLKYKIPILWGSIKITSLKTQVSLESCDSNINGFMGEGSINRMINQQIENFVEHGINDNQAAISDAIEDNLVPKVNKMLKGNDFWTLIDLIFSSSEGENEDDPIVTKCIPPEDPWA
ncbi:uncharacterized protein LOC119689531 [Teleopsis dalmanni]|uniref:uncharacterized protein LOC119689531 n=1 Tax=Teleopsis dalmanni TaxID=139649 RepID=UPI000D329C0A|nr:uncharacterized protein LOC119689531 [Teleopsis dalmanni]